MSAKPVTAPEGVQRQAWGPVLMGWIIAGVVPQWQPVNCDFLWTVVASSWYWLLDSGRAGVVLEVATMVVTSQFSWWLLHHPGVLQEPPPPGSPLGWPTHSPSSSMVTVALGSEGVPAAWVR